MQFTVVWL